MNYKHQHNTSIKHLQWMPTLQVLNLRLLLYHEFFRIYIMIGNIKSPLQHHNTPGEWSLNEGTEFWTVSLPSQLHDDEGSKLQIVWKLIGISIKNHISSLNDSLTISFKIFFSLKNKTIKTASGCNTDYTYYISLLWVVMSMRTEKSIAVNQFITPFCHVCILLTSTIPWFSINLTVQTNMKNALVMWLLQRKKKHKNGFLGMNIAFGIYSHKQPISIRTKLFCTSWV